MIITFAVLILICFICYFIGYHARKNEDRIHFDSIVRTLMDCRGNTDGDNRMINQAMRIANNCSIN